MDVTIWPPDGCAVCGLEWSDFCLQYHLPHARNMLVEHEEIVTRIRRKIEAAERIIVASKDSA